jgi:hypothetical protein
MPRLSGLPHFAVLRMSLSRASGWQAMLDCGRQQLDALEELWFESASYSVPCLLCDHLTQARLPKLRLLSMDVHAPVDHGQCLQVIALRLPRLRTLRLPKISLRRPKVHEAPVPAGVTELHLRDCTLPALRRTLLRMPSLTALHASASTEQRGAERPPFIPLLHSGRFR